MGGNKRPICPPFPRETWCKKSVVWIEGVPWTRASLDQRGYKYLKKKKRRRRRRRRRRCGVANIVISPLSCFLTFRFMSFSCYLDNLFPHSVGLLFCSSLVHRPPFNNIVTSKILLTGKSKQFFQMLLTTF